MDVPVSLSFFFIQSEAPFGHLSVATAPSLLEHVSWSIFVDIFHGN